jgi:ABC-type transport system substrate-binding protein
MTFKHPFPLFYLLCAGLPLLLFMSCSTSKNSVVTVNSSPVSSTKSDTLTTSKVTGTPFQSITIGENQPIHTLDPLFIQNISEMRTVQLIYEGLVRFNNQGKIVPAIAGSWTISNQHRQFRFILSDSVYYQDSPIFPSGRGRQLKPNDIKKDFERMAQADVPSCAAELFMNIRGFEPYFQAQHKVFRPSERQIHGISGIKVKNDSTIIFSLVHPDNHFLQKLASPYAVIYPPKAAKSHNFEAVGTGPFKLAQKRSDSLFIFARFKNYHVQNQPNLNRVDVVTSSNGMALLQAMKDGSIDLIPELDPQQIQDAAQKGGSLKSSFSQKYRLLESTGRSAVYELQYNSGADLPEKAVVHALSSVKGENFFPNLPANSVQFQWTLSGGSSSSTTDSLSSPYTGDPFIRTFYSMLAKKLEARNITFKTKKTRVANRNTALQTTQLMAPYAQFQSNGKNESLARFRIKIWTLAGNYLHNLSFNAFPWWINLRTVTVSSTNNR